VTTEPIKIIECPRDAWQAMPQLIPAEVKADYLRALISAGFRNLDAVSFVSPSAVPQMADSEQVLGLVGPTPGVEIIGIVVNERGAERAIHTERVSTLGFPYSISATFLARNQRQTMEQASHTLEHLVARAAAAGLGVVAYVSMAFGNPYGDHWRQEDVVAACQHLQQLGIAEISLADTVGVATPKQICSVVGAVLAQVAGVELGVHLHARPEQAADRVAAAYRAGCRRLDTALGGQGGCPFAQDALVGNLATEAALAELGEVGAQLPPLCPLDELLAKGRAIADKFGAAGNH
jgi:hydroxymethylglutaryl-CoA lyase